MDCTRYENCIKNQQVVIDLNRDRIFHMIAVGCWGVYCNDGEYIVLKYKKGKMESSKVIRGQRRIAEALIRYTQRNRVTDMYLAGDNIYQLGVKATDENSVERFMEEKRSIISRLTGKELDPLKNFDIHRQISEGFEKCFQKANIKRFFVAIGNHDIETCEILNTQYNYPQWIIPSLYYNVLYKLQGFTINVIVLDTNMFEDEPTTCSQNPFTEEQIERQVLWALETAKLGDWKIVIGHIPYLANGHKENKHPVIRKRLKSLIEMLKPQLYICADEHNQQLIKTKDTTIVIAGTGGAQLDPIIENNVVEGTLYQNSNFAFVSYQITEEMLKLQFISAENQTLFSHLIKR